MNRASVVGAVTPSVTINCYDHFQQRLPIEPDHEAEERARGLNE